MKPDPVSLMGGKSVHCINEMQMAEARRLLEEDSPSSAKIKSRLTSIEAELSRNERAALAFMIIQRLKESSPF